MTTLEVFRCGLGLGEGGEVTLADCKTCRSWTPPESWESRDEAGPGETKEEAKVPERNEPARPQPSCNDARPDMTVEEMADLIRRAPPGPWPTQRTADGSPDYDRCWAHWRVTKETWRRLIAQASRSLPPYPDHYKGRGVVIAGGGRYLPCVWVTVKKLRYLGCTLPVQVWHLGEGEMDPFFSRLLAPLGAQTVDARRMEAQVPARILRGWELKGYATAFCPFQEVLFLDADCVPLRNPEECFRWPEYQERGAVFWPDFDHPNVMGRMSRTLCDDLGVPWRDEPAFESGQFLVHKGRCWGELMLAWWILEHSDFYFSHFYGDKEAFHVAWRKLGTEYAMPPRPPGWDCGHTIVQHDFRGRRLFLHRCQDKWRLDGGNRLCLELEDESLHFEMLAQLRAVWPGRLWFNPVPTLPERRVALTLAGRRFLWRPSVGDSRELVLGAGGQITDGDAASETRWDVHEQGGQTLLAISGAAGPTCVLRHNPQTDTWSGTLLEPRVGQADLIPLG